MLKMTRQLESNTGRMNKALSQVNRNVGSLSNVFRGAARLAGTFGVALSVGALLSFTRRVVESTAELQALSVRLGASTEALSELQFVAEQSNVEFNVMSLGLQRMTRRIAEAAQGTGEAKGALQELGLSAQLLAQIPIDQQFENVAERLSLVRNESDRVRLAMKLFDSEGVALVQTMQRGAQGIREMRQEARNLGITLSTDAANAAARADSETKKFQSSVQALARDLTLELVPALTTAVEWWHRFLFPQQSELRQQLDEALQRVRNIQGFIQAGGPNMASQLADDLRMAQEEATRLFNLVQAQEAGSVVGGQGASDPFHNLRIPNLQELQEAFRWLDRIRTQALVNQQASLVGPLGQQGEMRLGYSPEAREDMAEAERTLTEIIEEQHRRRVTSAAKAAADEAQLVMDSQMQQLDFRTAVGQSIAQLAYAVFGEQKAVALAAIAFEKLMAVRRIKIAVEQAAWGAFASQLVPGDPSSLARAQAARAAVRAQGAVSVAQTVALSVISGLAEAARVVGSSGEPGSFTNPLSVTGGAAVAGTGAADVSAGHRQRVAEVHFHGPVYGFDEYMRRNIAESLRDLVNNHELVFISSESRQARELVRA